MKIYKPTVVEIVFMLFLGTQFYCGIKHNHWLGLIAFITITSVAFVYQWLRGKI